MDHEEERLERIGHLEAKRELLAHLLSGHELAREVGMLTMSETLYNGYQSVKKNIEFLKDQWGLE